MPGSLRSLAWAAVVAAGALIPLYGDSRSTAVTHAEWARMLLRGLEMDQAIQWSGRASQAFSTLSWKGSLSFPADRYLRGDGVQVVGETKRVVAEETPGDVTYPIAVVRAGDYRLRFEIAGSPAAPAEAQVTPLGAATPLKTFSVAPAAAPGWIEAGSLYLDPGSYTASMLLPPGTSLDRIEVAPPCLRSIEPPAGWKATAVTSTSDIAVTALQAIDAESELPPAAAAAEFHGSDFRTAGPRLVAAAQTQGEVESLWLRAGPAGLQADLFVNLAEPGLYVVSTFGILGGGQVWLADACRKEVLCGARLAGAEAPAWRTVMTAEFHAGRHFFRVILGPGAGIERVRLEHKKQDVADYVATLKRLGFDAGPEGPVTRKAAVDAMNFVKRKRAELLATRCGDTLTEAAPPVVQAGLAQPVGPVAGPAPPPPNTGQGPAPITPPQLPASPTTLGGP